MLIGFCIDDEHYTDLVTFTGDTVDSIIEEVRSFTDFEDYDLEKDEREDGSIWVSFCDKNSEAFYILQIFNIDAKDIVVHWHAYDGVEFKVYPNGKINKLVDKCMNQYSSKPNIDVKEDDFVCIDDGCEWLMWKNLTF